jgi:hypothetical protein
MRALSGLVAFSVAFAGACSSPSQTSSGAGGSHSVHGPTSSASGAPDAGPIKCPGAVSSNIAKGPCDLLQQDCPAGETCTPIQVGATWTTSCESADGLKGPGETCDHPSECRAGTFCLQSGQCTMPCCPDNDEPCGGGTCNVSVNFASGPSAPTVEMCAYSKQCRLLTPGACDPGQDCHIEDPSQGLATCTAPSDNVVGELGTCTYLNDCHDNQECFRLPGETTGTCYWYCYRNLQTPALPGEGGCPTGETCVDSIDGIALDFGVPNIGLCHG